MKSAVEMGSGAIIYLPDWFRNSEVNRVDSQTAWRSHKPNYIFLFKLRNVF
jgi:hypothetical protein